MEAVIDTVVLYLHRVGARLDEIFEARIVLEGIASELASERADGDDAGGTTTQRGEPAAR